jgi:hypothetical protein
MFVSRRVKAVAEAERYPFALATLGVAIQTGYVMAEFWRWGHDDDDDDDAMLTTLTMMTTTMIMTMTMMMM